MASDQHHSRRCSLRLQFRSYRNSAEKDRFRQLKADRARKTCNFLENDCCKKSTRHKFYNKSIFTSQRIPMKVNNFKVTLRILKWESGPAIDKRTAQNGFIDMLKCFKKMNVISDARVFK